MSKDAAMIATEILETAAAGKQTKFSFIRNLNEYDDVKAMYNSTKTIIRWAKVAEKKLYNTYVSNLKKNKEETDLLFSYRVLKNCVDYYTTELDTLSLRLIEYRHYLFHGHLLYSLFRDRKEEDLYDFTESGLRED